MFLEISELKVGTQGYYVVSPTESTNFLLELLAVKVVYTRDKPRNTYCVGILMATGRKYQVDVDADEITKKKVRSWFPELPYFPDWQTELMFYNGISNAIAKAAGLMKSTEVILEKPGFQLLDGKLGIAYSNGWIDSSGWNSHIRCKNRHKFFPSELPKSDAERMELCNTVYSAMMQCPNVFVPVFMISLAAMLKLPLRTCGVPTGITLWLYGNHGSGKTELAKNVAQITTSTPAGDKFLTPATEKSGIVLRGLVESNGDIFVLDDVKQESVQNQRAKVRTNVDNVLRGTYQGYIVETKKECMVGTCSLVTGEYLETTASQNARILFLDISGFLKQEKSSKALRFFQDDPRLLASMIGDIQQWLMAKLAENQFGKDLLIQWRMLQKERRYGIGEDANRRFDAICQMRMILEVLGKYHVERGIQDITEKLCFREHANRALEKVEEATARIQGALEAMIIQAVTEIMQDSVVMVADYDGSCSWNRRMKYQQEQFAFYNDEHFVYIHSMARSNLIKTEADQYEDSHDAALIVDADWFMDALNSKISRYAEAGEIPLGIRNKVSCRLLAEMQLLYVTPKGDNDYRYAAKFPIIRWERATGERNHEYSEVDGLLAYQLNVNHVALKIFKRIGHIQPMFTCDIDQVGEEKIINLREQFFKNRALLGGEKRHG